MSRRCRTGDERNDGLREDVSRYWFSMTGFIGLEGSRRPQGPQALPKKNIMVMHETLPGRFIWLIPAGVTYSKLQEVVVKSGNGVLYRLLCHTAVSYRKAKRSFLRQSSPVKRPCVPCWMAISYTRGP